MRPDRQDVLSIVDRLGVVARQRELRRADPSLGTVVQRLRAYQCRRFERTYSDLLQIEGSRQACLFFLNEIYSPGDFERRDAEFQRIVSSIARLFPGEVLETVGDLTKLHALSEVLDTRMGECLRFATVIDAETYAGCWRQCCSRAERREQISLTLKVGYKLQAFVQHHRVERALRLMRVPAQIAGLGQLQRFLELGFSAFSGLASATEFLSIIEEREQLFEEAIANGLSPEF